jgi:hypothetical protein
MPFCTSQVLAAHTLQVSYAGNACTPRGGLRSARVSRTRRGGVRLGFARRRKAKVRVTVQRVTRRGLRRVLSTRRSRPVTLRHGRLGRGTYVATFRIRTANGRVDQRRRAFRVAGRRVRRLAAFARDPSCAMVTGLALRSPVVGRRARLAFRLDRTARVTVRVLRGKRTVRRLKLGTKQGETGYSVVLRRLRKGAGRVRLDARSAGGRRTHATLHFRRR